MYTVTNDAALRLFFVGTSEASNTLEYSQSTSVFFEVDRFPERSRLYERRASARRLDPTALPSATLHPPHGCSSLVARRYSAGLSKCTDIMSLDSADCMVDPGVHLVRFFPGCLRVRQISSAPSRAIQPDMSVLEYCGAGKTVIASIYFAEGHLKPFSCVIMCITFLLHEARHVVGPFQGSPIQAERKAVSLNADSFCEAI
jgi:hypothetical protein